MISDQKLEDIKLHKELLDVLDVLTVAYQRHQCPHVGELIVDTYNWANEIKRKIDTHSYYMEKIPLNMV